MCYEDIHRPIVTNGAYSIGVAVRSYRADKPNRDIPNFCCDMFVDMINQARSQSGTSKVLYDPILARYAEIRAQDMINQNYYDHRAPNGNDFSSLLPNMNLYHCENLDMGVGSFENAIVSWTNSQDHNDCMVHENVSRVGYAYADAGAVMYPDGLHNTYILVAIFGE